MLLTKIAAFAFTIAVLNLCKASLRWFFILQVWLTDD